MSIEHKSIADAERHEPKGISTASAGQIYICSAAGAGVWRYIPHGACYYSDIGTGTTITTPTAYTLIGPATVGDAIPRDFTHNSLGRLTYTGATAIDISVAISITLTHSSATLVDTLFQIHKNGIAITGAEHGTAALSGNYTHASLHSHTGLVTNDYIEVYVKSASGNVVIHSMNLSIKGEI